MPVIIYHPNNIYVKKMFSTLKNKNINKLASSNVESKPFVFPDLVVCSMNHIKIMLHYQGSFSFQITTSFWNFVFSIVNSFELRLNFHVGRK